VANEISAVDWDDFADWVAGLDNTSQRLLRDAARTAKNADRYRHLVDAVRECVEREVSDREAMAVFDTVEWGAEARSTAIGPVRYAVESPGDD
jgi:hypothetical protein